MSTATVASSGSAASNPAKLANTLASGSTPASDRITAIQPALQPSTPATVTRLFPYRVFGSATDG